MKALIDVHTHTIVSGHAYSTLKENIEEAKKNGLKYLGTSEHAPNMPGAPHPYYFHNIYVIPREIDGVIILKGMEANIIDYDGNLDVEEDMLKNMDYLIASLHTPCIAWGNIEENTNAILNAMDREKVKIIGHPDDNRYPLDYEKIVKKAKEKNILLEVNNSSLKPRSFRAGARDNIKIMLELCKRYETKVILGSDAHVCYDVGNFKYSKEVLEELDFPMDLVVNYHEEEINKIFDIQD